MNSLILEEIDKHDANGNVIGTMEMKSITLYDEYEFSPEEEFLNYNKDDIPFLSFEIFDEVVSSSIGEPCLKEVLRLKITEEESDKIKKFITKDDIVDLYKNGI